MSLKQAGATLTTSPRRLGDDVEPPQGGPSKRSGMFDFIGTKVLRSDRRASHMSEPPEQKTFVTLGSVERPIRLDRTLADEERLNTIVREVQQARQDAPLQEISRLAKMSAVEKEINNLKNDRMRYSLEVPGWSENSWRQVNIQKVRSPRQGHLHHVAPEQKRQLLRSIEQETALWAPYQGEEAQSEDQDVKSARSTARGTG
eukprot:CAMPEP_0183462710 /NCGR_PEP_ID=MMETSP0370-20130417/142205_1 /TAXON_ID=268820 /ORGANISM="Peridinium aciculiferum, Strain PAER-2" /LENGTH=201 /DNA_ID=CAMNT_0025654757 /DNA_START=39 /DNA_END=644 /DNA_ORIENTATION=+